MVQEYLVHRGRRRTRLARRDEGANRESVTEEQRSQTGCIGGRMPRYLPHGMIQRLVGPRVEAGALRQRRPDVLEQRHVVADADRFGMRHRQRERLRQLAHGLQAARLAVLLREHVLQRRRQQMEPLGRRSHRPCGPVEPVEQAAADLVLLQHHLDRLLLVQRRLPPAAALGVGRQRPLQLVGQAEVVDDESPRLVPEHAVDPRDCLHQPMAAHRLVHVHRVQARRVEAREPHVAHEHHAERVGGVAEPCCQRLPPRLVADMRLPRRPQTPHRAGHAFTLAWRSRLPSVRTPPA